MAGLAQKGGPVTSHVRLAPSESDIKAIRVAAGGADLVLGCDLVTAGATRSLAAIAHGRTSVFVNTHETYPGEFTRNADLTLPGAAILERLEERAGADRLYSIDASRIATALLGDSITTNMFMLGFAWQAGAVPLSRAAIERAIELNGVELARNKAAFAWGRRAAVEPETVMDMVDRRLGRRDMPAVAPTLSELIARRVDFLTAYQDADYAGRYAVAVGRIRRVEALAAPGQTALAEAVAVNLFKLMAIKDEYEVARLFTDGSFQRQLRRQFGSWRRLEFHLAPPLLGDRDPVTGHLKKRTYGPWMVGAFRLLAGARRLRGTRFDPFGHTAERKRERHLLAEYEETLATLEAGLSAENHQRGIALARWPETVRGFGHVKEAAIVRARVDAGARRELFLAETVDVAQAAE
jgi:indolepyruvate ferredoxin oxidoreductase